MLDPLALRAHLMAAVCDIVIGLRRLSVLTLSRPGILMGLLLFLAGTGGIAWDYALHLPSPANYAWFWAGMAACLVGMLAIGLHSRGSAGAHVIMLGLFGAALWLPYFLRSPAHLFHTDELYQYQALQLIGESGHAHIIRTGPYVIPGDYPGLQFATLGLMDTSGLPMDVAVRIMPLLAHILIPLLSYLVARGLGLGKSTSFIATMVYITNTSYFFVHSIFGYETLGVVLFLALWVVLARTTRRGVARRDLALIIPLLFAAAATHHLSAYLLALSVTIAWLTRRFLARARRDAMGVVALLSILFPVAWLGLRTIHASSYLYSTVAVRIAYLLVLFKPHASAIRHLFGLSSNLGSRHLFALSTLPVWERLIAFMYPPLLPVLGLAGLFLVFRRGGWRRTSPLLRALAIFGPVLWSMTTPFILTASSDAFYRTWPFFFLGLAMYCGIALTAIVTWLGAHWRPVAWSIVAVVIGILLVGGISIGDDQAGRFPLAQAQKAAGPEDMTADAIGAAKWLNRTSGRYHLIVGDYNTQTTFAVFGLQRAALWGSWIPFVVKYPNQLLYYIHATHTEYIVTDQRDTTLPSRYMFYFGAPENDLLRQEGYATSRTFPRQLIAKFDQVPFLSRIYDNGNFQIYDLAGSGLPQFMQWPTAHHLPRIDHRSPVQRLSHIHHVLAHYHADHARYRRQWP